MGTIETITSESNNKPESYAETVQDLLNLFSSGKRDNGETFYKVQPDTSLHRVIRDLHDGIFPHDWIFEKCHDLLLALSGYDLGEKYDEFNFDEYSQEIVDCAVDIYTRDLYDWAKTFGHFVDDAREEYGTESSDIITQLSTGQFHQLNQFYNALVELIKNETI